ncbi:MAG TPA: hypothetical protein ENJ62_06455 [Bryobacterales bacterium]|nr:hypothetical protein [Bryobacterales bacterium]
MDGHPADEQIRIDAVLFGLTRGRRPLAAAVRAVVLDGRTPRDAGREHRIPENTVRRWAEKFRNIYGEYLRATGQMAG